MRKNGRKVFSRKEKRVKGEKKSDQGIAKG